MTASARLKPKLNPLRPYTVHFRTYENRRLENCFYAADAFEARSLAMEFNKYLRDHPNSIDLIRCEINFDKN